MEPNEIKIKSNTKNSLFTEGSLFQFYLSAKGEITRTEFCLKGFIPLATYFVLAFIYESAGGLLDANYKKILSIILVAILFYSIIVVSIKRLHNVKRSGWFLFILYLPVIGPFWLVYELFFKKGKKVIKNNNTSLNIFRKSKEHFKNFVESKGLINGKQKILFIIVIFTTFVIFMFPPYVVNTKYWGNRSGFSFIFDINRLAVINTGLLFLEILGILIIGTLLFFILHDYKSDD